MSGNNKDKDSDKDSEGMEAIRRAGRSKPVMDKLAKLREKAEKRDKDKGKDA